MDLTAWAFYGLEMSATSSLGSGWGTGMKFLECPAGHDVPQLSCRTLRYNSAPQNLETPRNSSPKALDLTSEPTAVKTGLKCRKLLPIFLGVLGIGFRGLGLGV